MKSETLLAHLEDLVESLGYTIRKERGSFRGDHCIIEGERMVIINKNRPLDLQIGLYARLLKGNVENMYIKPAVRKELVDLWKQLDLLNTSSNSDNAVS